MGSQSTKKKITLWAIALGCALSLLITPVLLECFLNLKSQNTSLAWQLFKNTGLSLKDDVEFVEFLNVGQGDSTIIKSGSSTALIDCGLESETNTVVDRLLNLGVKSLDLVVITHHHSDHVGEFENIVRNFKIHNLLICNTVAKDGETSFLNTALFLADIYNIKVYFPKMGGSFKIGQAILKIIYVNKNALEENNRSIVTMLNIGNKKVLFTGDCEEENENILADKYDINCDILKMGHHGSNTSSSTNFLKKASPQVAIASCGYDNIYNHPSDEAVLRVEEHKIKIYRTDLDRNIRCEFNKTNNTFSVVTDRG